MGIDSPTFIEPIASRKDGIRAMFLHQAHSSPSKDTAMEFNNPVQIDTQTLEVSGSQQGERSLLSVLDHTVQHSLLEIPKSTPKASVYLLTFTHLGADYTLI